MKIRQSSLLLLLLVLLASACGHKTPANTDQATSNTAASAPARSATVAADPATAATSEFNLDQIPVSNAPLGKFPFFGLPPKYAPQNTPKAPGFGHFLFWTGKALKDVEGQTYMVTIITPDSGDFNTYDLKKNMLSLFQQAGGVKIAEGKIPQAVLDAIPETTRQELLMGLGDIWNNPVETWVVRRPHDAIWIHYTTNTAQASLAVVQTKAFALTAALLPLDQLKTDLDKTGRAVIHLNFATDQAKILPNSKQQMDAVVALLKADPTLKLAINGYTDDTGSNEHNVALSDARAKAVQAALLTVGIKPDRLQAKGYGTMNPVTTNTDEAGKAANRRVELVKL